MVSEALKSEAKAVSYWKVLDLDGNLIDADKFDFTDHEKLQKFTNYEISKARAVDKVPPHVELMRRLELVDYEPGSDPGNMRFYPKGRLIKSLLENYVLDKASDMGAMEVETPIMYDMEHPTLKKYLDRFPARQYQIDSDKKKLFLRFAACFGQFLMGHDMSISYKAMPLKMFEITRYSFRREQRGELVGIRRLRAFTMPDMHTLARDMNSAMEEFRKQYLASISVLSEVGIDLADYEVAIRFTKDFYNENREFIEGLVDIVKKPVLIEMWDERFFYFVLKFEFNFVDTLDKASALATVQIDVENAERYDITYIDEAGEKQQPILLHCSPSGAIERVMYALLEKAARLSEEGKLPMLQTWLSPTQIQGHSRGGEAPGPRPGDRCRARFPDGHRRPRRDGGQEDSRCRPGVDTLRSSDRRRGAGIRQALRYHSRRIHAQVSRQVQDDCGIPAQKSLCRDRRQALAQTAAAHEAHRAAQVHLSKKKHRKRKEPQARRASVCGFDLFLFSEFDFYSFITIDLNLRLRHWESVHSRPTRNVEDPS